MGTWPNNIVSAVASRTGWRFFSGSGGGFVMADISTVNISVAGRKNIQ